MFGTNSRRQVETRSEGTSAIAVQCQLKLSFSLNNTKGLIVIAFLKMFEDCAHFCLSGAASIS